MARSNSDSGPTGTRTPERTRSGAHNKGAQARGDRVPAKRRDRPFDSPPGPSRDPGFAGPGRSFRIDRDRDFGSEFSGHVDFRVTVTAVRLVTDASAGAAVRGLVSAQAIRVLRRQRGSRVSSQRRLRVATSGPRPGGTKQLGQQTLAFSSWGRSHCDHSDERSRICHLCAGTLQESF
jgi:hypothetical protein